MGRLHLPPWLRSAPVVDHVIGAVFDTNAEEQARSEAKKPVQQPRPPLPQLRWEWVDQVPIQYWTKMRRLLMRQLL